LLHLGWIEISAPRPAKTTGAAGTTTVILCQ